jgi:glycosyltransferase involved in cell wall biosynthesis
LVLGLTKGPAVIMDLDMLSSRLVGLRWEQEPSLRNRWFLFERIKLDRFERRLLARPALVLFSNPVELADQRKRVENLSATLAVLPNVMPELAPLTDAKVQPVILFFGSLNSAANTDAFRFLVADVLPYLEADLQRHGVKIHVVGKNPPAWMEKLLKDAGSDRVVLVGGVASMERAIAESRFVFLPLRVASGTRTRILEAAAVGRAVVTTALGAEGIEVGDDALIADEPEQLAAAVRTLLENPARAEQLGQRLRERCQVRYSAPRVAQELVREVSQFLPSGKGGPA